MSSGGTAVRVEEVLRSGRFDKLTVAQARAVIDSEASLERVPVTQRFYFGCHRQAGHYLFDQYMRSQRWPWSGAPSPFPWDRIDGALNPAREVEGEALLHHKDGWTALAFADRSVDSRPGSNSAFLFDSRLSFDEALADAREHFPAVFERITFPIVQVDGPTRRR